MAEVFPLCEEERIDALNRLELLDSAPEACFDRITQLVADSLQVPIALISLVDRNRQWFKSRIGIEQTESSRDGAFCARTILADDPFVVSDASDHPEFRQSELVCGELGIRFYAGVPLHAHSGLRIGALCVMDHKPRPGLDEQELRLLKNLAALVEELLRVRFAVQRLNETESALRKADRSYRSLVENSPLGIYRTALDGTILFANPAVLKMLGFDSLEQLASPELDRDRLAPNRARVQALLESNGEVRDCEATWHKRDGTPIRVRESARAFRDENGQPLYYEGTVEDITEQHIARAKVREQEQRWESVVRGNKDGIWEWNRETGKTWYSDRYVEMLGYKPGELSSGEHEWEDRIHPEDLERVKELLAAHVRGETDPYEAEYRLRCKDGTYKWILARGKAYIEPNAGIRRMIGSHTDITARKMAEEHLRAAEERYRHLFQFNPLPVIVYDQETLRILAVNEAAERVYVYRSDELLSLHITDLVPERLRAGANTTLKSLKKFPYRSVPFENITKDGRTILAEATIHNIEFDRRPAHVAIVNDVTEITRAQQELQAALTQAEEASRSKSRFLATMSHEIRTPMNGVIGMTNLLLNTELESEQRDYVETIRSSGEVLLNIINDVLDFSKIESGRLEFEQVEVQLQRVVQEAVGLTAPAAKSKNLAVQVQIAPEVPVTVNGDPGRLCQVLLNLLGNAIKFTQKGQVTVGLSVDDMTAEAVRVRVTVRDTGIGIEADKLQTLFEPFTQADVSTTRRFGGTGLGLAISKSLVELMGGEIGCTSMPGVGSTFWFVVPMARAAASKKALLAAGRSLERPAKASAQKSLRVLVAEDNAVNQKLVVHLLRRMGHVPDVVPNGRKAVEAFQEFPYRLILMDSHMPEMDGFEATQMIRAHEGPEQKSVIISITANALEGDRERSLAAGMDDYIAKPVDAALFEAKMNYWIDALTHRETVIMPAPARRAS